MSRSFTFRLSVENANSKWLCVTSLVSFVPRSVAFRRLCRDYNILRFDYDTTTTYRARLFHLTRAKIFRRSRIVVESQL